jgi:peptide/nickel transport system substrate-binding protein
VVGVLAAAVTLASYGMAAPQRPLVYASYADIKDWDPAIAFSLESVLLLNVYEPLIWCRQSGGEMRFEPALATSWSQSDDKLSWTFKLRDGVTFHDGTPFDAEAAKASLQRTIALKKGASYIWDGVESIEAPDPRTLVIRTKEPAPIDLIASAQYGAYIYSPAAAEKGTDWFNRGNAAGTGPYRVVSWEKNDRVLLEANPDYWGGAPEEQFKRAVIKVVREASTQIQLIRSGDADIISLVPVDLLGTFGGDVTVELAPSWYNSQILLNTARAPTDVRAFRQALLHAWDYEGVTRYIYANAATVPEGPVPNSMWGSDPGRPRPKFDLEEARRLIEASGVPPAQRRIYASYVGSSLEYANALLLYQANLAKIGVDLVLQPGPWEAIWDAARNARTAPHMITMTWWPTYASPADWLSGLFATQNTVTFNLSRYSNPEFDRLVKEGRALEATDRAGAIAKYEEAQRVLLGDAPAVFFADLKTRLVYRSDLTGVTLNPAYAGVRFADLRRKE